MKKTRWAIPYFLTVSNLFCGLLAVVYGLNEAFVAAAWLIIVAGFLDGLDGKIARFAGSSSRFGVEFDSMADLVSFGVAPAVLLYKYQFHLLEFWGWVLVFTYTAAGAFRLARFNLHYTGVREDSFKGMPITMAGMTVAALVIFCTLPFVRMESQVLTAGLVLLLSALMVSTIRYEGLPRFTLETRKDKAKAIILFVSAIAIAVRPSLVFFPLMAGYLLLGILEWAFCAVWRRAALPADESRRRNM